MKANCPCGKCFAEIPKEESENPYVKDQQIEVSGGHLVQIGTKGEIKWVGTEKFEPFAGEPRVGIAVNSGKLVYMPARHIRRIRVELDLPFAA